MVAGRWWLKYQGPNKGDGGAGCGPMRPGKRSGIVHEPHARTKPPRTKNMIREVKKEIHDMELVQSYTCDYWRVVSWNIM